LQRRLLDADGPSLGLVLGPPGSGKTTLLSRVAAAAGEQSAWYRAGPEDEDEPALVRHLAQALNTALTKPGGSGGVPPGIGTAPRLGAAAEAGSVAALVLALEGADGLAGRLVVDDLHEIAGSRAESALERFVLLRPRGVRILLGSRRPPALNTTRLLVSGELYQLDGEDLRFRSWEVEELFRVVYDRPLSPEAAAALTRRTGGWAAGLQLFHLATSAMSRPERERAVAELSGRSRLIRSYLARNVLEGLPAERRRFLLRTCTLGVLTGESCDRLLETTGSAVVLDELERLQFFTTSTDGGITYRYHQVLQAYLEVVLVDELGGSAARDLYSRSGQLLEEAGRTAAAVRAHARAEDWGAVGRLLQHTVSMLPAEDDRLWASMSLSGALADDPGLLVASARRLWRDGMIGEAVTAFRHAEGLMDDPDFRARWADERAIAAVWLPDAVIEPGRQPSTDRGLRLARELRHSLLTVGDLNDPESLVRGLNRLLSGQTAAAYSTLQVALSAPGLAPWERLALRLAVQLAALGEPDGSAAGQLEEVILSADTEGLSWLSRVARGLQAVRLLMSDPTPWRMATCADLVIDCERHGDRWAQCLLAGVVGFAHARVGEDGTAGRLLRQAAELAAGLNAPVLAVWANSLAAESEQRAGTENAPAEATQLGLAGLTTPGSATRRPGVADGRDIRLACLGEFRLNVTSVAVDWRTLRPRARWLLMRLGMEHGRAVHRERLVDDLWPDATLTAGIRSLQVAASSVRQCLAGAGLPEDSLRREADAYALRLPGCVDQLRDFERLVRQADREDASGRRSEALRCRLDALDLYTGDLLPEVGPAEWVVGERDRLRVVAARVGAEGARLAYELEDFDRAIRAAQRSLQLDPFHDPSWTLLAELHEQLGDHSAAAMTRREHARVVADLITPGL
jgi:ATP/maltotriose-dependent transcriptional regulator MalT/DNA-binding SARP family transcriptional activator